MIPKKHDAVDHQAPEERDAPHSLEDLVDFESEQSFPGSDAPSYYAGGCSKKQFKSADLAK